MARPENRDYTRDSCTRWSPERGLLIVEEKKEDGVISCQQIDPSDLYCTLNEGYNNKDLLSGGFPPEHCLSMAMNSSERYFVPWNPELRADLTYSNTEYPDFPLPRLVLGIRMLNTGRIAECSIGVAADESPRPETAMYEYSLSNVHPNRKLCAGNNVLPRYKNILSMKYFPRYVLGLPDNDDLYDREHNRFGFGHAELMERLRDKDSAYYYTDVLVPCGDTLGDFTIGRQGTGQRTAKQTQEALAKPFAAGDLEWRLQKAYPQEMCGIVVPYVTNRTIQYRLDDMVGAGNWYNRFEPWHKFVTKVPSKENYRKLEDKEIIFQLCGVAIYFIERKEWVCRWGGAEFSEIEPVKGGLSDSVKWAVCQWDIGRVLYDVNTVWVDTEKKGKTWFIWDDQRQKLDNAYLKLLDRLGLKPTPVGGTETPLVPKDIPEQEEGGAPPDIPGPVQSTLAPEQKPGAACSTQPVVPSAAPKGSTAKAEQAQVSSAVGSRSRIPSSAPSRNTYEYRVAASKVQKGMSTVNTPVRLEAADGKQVDVFAPGEHHVLAVGTLLTGARLPVHRQDIVVFYVLKDYRITIALQVVQGSVISI